MKNADLKRFVILALFTLLISAVYLTWCVKVNGIGFPLDDAWIHQTFARNLAEDGQWTFNEGQTAAGSTSPLWTLLLSIGYVLHFQPVWWTMGLGICGLLCTGVLCERMWRRYQSVSDKHFLPFFGLLILSEWHLIWAALSGMETILYILTVCAIFYILLKKTPAWLAVGFLTGLLVWIRPDGLTLLGPVLFLAIWNPSHWKKKVQFIGLALAGALLPVAAYMIFNFSLGGTIWPNTLYAKQTEYAIMRERPLTARFFDLFSQLQVGAGIALLPGFIYKLVRVVKTRDAWGIAAYLWVTGYIGIYAVQLPVVYQHARYLIPILPVFLLLGFSGFICMYQSIVQKRKEIVLAGKTWAFILVGIQCAFCLLGARAYAMDTAVIETEMVQTAKWIAANLPTEQFIATHDIGAIGYFTDNELVDLAGLIDPEVIPFMRDEDKLLEYIQSRQARYLVTFEDWYPDLILHGERIFITNARFSPEQGGTNMAVYVMQ